MNATRLLLYPLLFVISLAACTKTDIEFKDEDDDDN